jgi:hypothetical protein
VVRILWRDKDGKTVLHDEPSYASYRPGERPRAEPEFPVDERTLDSGWTQVRGLYQVPADARQAAAQSHAAQASPPTARSRGRGAPPRQQGGPERRRSAAAPPWAGGQELV